ncbi:MAG TPA: hypothetical protein VFG60_03155, partial [Burkholderiaceae bacterium]|nr:hypothetical protein [Burkholderiaceae bacterium]
MTLPRRWAGFTLAQRLLATLLLFFIAAATAFALLERAARETARAQQLLDIRAYFVARVAV